MQTKCHLSQLIQEQAKIYGTKKALTYCEFGSDVWTSMSWDEFAAKVQVVSNALLNSGVKAQENIGVFSQNSLQYVLTDFGAYGVRVVSVPFYATSSEQQIQYMIEDAQIRILFVGEQDQYDKAFRVLPLCSTLERIVVFDRRVKLSQQDKVAMYYDDFLKLGEGLPRQSELENIYKQANDDDLSCILYTSGTTGDSKGVVITYGQFQAALWANGECVPVTDNDRAMSFLPYTHIFERAWMTLCLSVGAEVIINTNPREIQKSLREQHPTAMSAVPRFWEKIMIGVRDKIDRSSPMQKSIFLKAIEIGRKHNIEYLSHGKRPPLALRMQYEVVNKTIFSLVRKQIGLENAHLFPTAGATVSPEVEEFILSIGIGMVVGYGLTESLATVSCVHMDKPYTIGSVGRLISGLQIKFGENDEILLKGPTITRGYYKRDALNAQAFDAEGFFRTGDSGYMKDGELFLKDRIKDLFKTSNGKYIAPQMIESKILVDKFVEQVAIIADERKFVSALIVPSFPMIEEYARDNGIQYESMEDLCSNISVIEMMAARLDTLQQQLASYEKIKKFTLIPRAFTIENGELTNTLKIKRAVLNKTFAEVIEKMYEE
ncbi:MAG: long-chain fatty acid--CoA ligase [Prevotella sp.]|nr:long-chain fatty acid--CoA ligase [Prevotella sp.]